MNVILYILTLLLLLAWFIGYFLLGAGTLVHLLLILAVVPILFSTIRPGQDHFHYHSHQKH